MKDWTIGELQGKRIAELEAERGRLRECISALESEREATLQGMRAAARFHNGATNVTYDQSTWPGILYIESCGRKWDVEVFYDQLWVNGTPWGPNELAPQLPPGWSVGRDSDGDVEAIHWYADTCEWFLGAWIDEDGTEDHGDAIAVPVAVRDRLRAEHRAMGRPCPWDRDVSKTETVEPPVYDCDTCRHDGVAGFAEPCLSCPEDTSVVGGWEPNSDPVANAFAPLESLWPDHVDHCAGCEHEHADPEPYACTDCDEGSNRNAIAQTENILLTKDEWGDVLDRLAALEMGEDR